MRTMVAILALSCACEAQVMQLWQIPCNEEVVRPNFEVKTKQHIFGNLKDPSGAALENSKVLLRRQNEKAKFSDYRNGITDRNGHFDLNVVDLGNIGCYRRPTEAGSNQSIACTGETECELNLVLDLNPSDQPFTGCPIQ